MPYYAWQSFCLRRTLRLRCRVAHAHCGSAEPVPTGQASKSRGISDANPPSMERRARVACHDGVDMPDWRIRVNLTDKPASGVTRWSEIRSMCAADGSLQYRQWLNLSARGSHRRVRCCACWNSFVSGAAKAAASDRASSPWSNGEQSPDRPRVPAGIARPSTSDAHCSAVLPDPHPAPLGRLAIFIAASDCAELCRTIEVRLGAGPRLLINESTSVQN